MTSSLKHNEVIVLELLAVGPLVNPPQLMRAVLGVLQTAGLVEAAGKQWSITPKGREALAEYLAVVARDDDPDDARDR